MRNVVYFYLIIVISCIQIFSYEKGIQFTISLSVNTTRIIPIQYRYHNRMMRLNAMKTNFQVKRLWISCVLDPPVSYSYKKKVYHWLICYCVSECTKLIEIEEATLFPSPLSFLVKYMKRKLKRLQGVCQWGKKDQTNFVHLKNIHPKSKLGRM